MIDNISDSLDSMIFIKLAGPFPIVVINDAE